MLESSRSLTEIGRVGQFCDFFGSGGIMESPESLESLEQLLQHRDNLGCCREGGTVLCFFSWGGNMSMSSCKVWQR